MYQESFSVGPPMNGFSVSINTPENNRFKPAKYALSKSLPFSLMRRHYQYCKGCNLFGSLERAVN